MTHKNLNDQQNVDSTILMNKFKQELVDLYMQGWFDREMGYGEDEADVRGTKYVNQLIKKYKISELLITIQQQSK